MSDIIERLHGPDGMEAGQEILRLREENARLREENDAWRMDGGSCAGEVKRLREESEKLRDGVRSTIQERDVLSGENWDLREENARLREALKPFAGLFLYPDDLGFEHSEDIRSDPDWDDDANDMQSEDVFVLRRNIRRARIAIRGGGNDE